MASHSSWLLGSVRHVNLKVCRKRLVAELILEAAMLMAPVGLEFLGLAGEYLLEECQAKIEFAA